jgi:Fur family transcriptional regulator, ferric uptake regulator
MIMMKNNNDYKEVLKKEGIKNTKRRNAIMKVLENAETPLTVEEIFLALKDEHASIWLSTVYRTLEILTEKELVIKSTIIGDDRARYELNHNDHKHHVVCVECHKRFSFEDCPVNDFEKALKERMDFNVTGHKLEIYGYCKDCQLDK